MSSLEEKHYKTEESYKNVMHEIDKAITDGDTDRAQAMASRAATGRPKIFPKLDDAPEHLEESIEEEQQDKAA